MKKSIYVIMILLCFSFCLTACQNADNGLITTITVKGYGGDIVLDVTIDSDKITKITAVSHNETSEYASQEAIDELLERIIAQQSLGIDVIAGATITSRAIFKGIADTVEQTGGNPADFDYMSVEMIAAADEIIFIGLPNGEAVLSGAQIMAMQNTSVDTQSVNSSGKVTEINAVGVLLETVLDELGVSQKDYESILFTASDGYSIEVPKDILQNRDILLAWEVNGEPQNIRSVVPDERAMYWAKFIVSIELKGEVEVVQIDTIGILETMIAGLPGEDYKYYDSTDKAVPISALLDKYVQTKADFVTFNAADDLEKKDKYDTVAAQFIKYTGENAPMFIGPTLPAGMRLKNLLSMQVAHENIISVETLMLQYADSSEEAILLSILFENANMIDAPSYTFEGADGYSVEIETVDIEKGVIRLTDGIVQVSFDILTDNIFVKELLYIKANKGG